MRIAVALALWLAFTVLVLAGIVVAPVAILAGHWGYAKELGAAMDRLGAAVLGWGGDNTISAECGSRNSDCRFCKFVCWMLNLVQPGHCEGAAKHEGLK